MTSQFPPTGLTPNDYRCQVDRVLRARCGATVEGLHAETAVRACLQAGLTPEECAAWLIRVHRLTPRPGAPRPGLRP